MFERVCRAVAETPAATAGGVVSVTVSIGVANVRVLRESPVPPTLAEAVRTALWLETSAVESRYRNSLRSANPELERLLSCLGSEDRGHLERLVTFAKSRGLTPEQRAAVLPRSEAETVL